MVIDCSCCQHVFPLAARLPDLPAPANDRGSSAAHDPAERHLRQAGAALADGAAEEQDLDPGPPRDRSKVS